MTAEQCYGLLRSHFSLLSLTENIKTEINNITIPARILNYKKAQPQQVNKPHRGLLWRYTYAFSRFIDLRQTQGNRVCCRHRYKRSPQNRTTSACRHSQCNFEADSASWLRGTSWRK